MADDDLQQTLEQASQAAAGLAEGMGQLVAARRTLTEGGFSPEVAEGIVFEALRAALRTP